MIKTIIGRFLQWAFMTVVCLALWPIFIQGSNMAPDPVSSFIMAWMLPTFWLGISAVIWKGGRVPVIVPFVILPPMDVDKRD